MPLARRIGWKLHRLKVDHVRGYSGFSAKSRKKMLFLTLPDSICKAQVFPFFFHAAELRIRKGLEVAEATLAAFRRSPKRFSAEVDAVAFQTGFDLAPGEMSDLVSEIRAAFPQARIAYLDWFAPTDLRYASVLNDSIDVYVKKHLLRDPDQYGKTTLGDTNLTDYYSRRFNLKEPPTRFEVPSSFFSKVVIGSNFSFADYIVPYFGRPFPGSSSRPIDLHARITTEGTGWYSAMRGEARDRVKSLEGLTVACQGRVSRPQYLRELFRSKLCFSPFGYGEVCWRDYEAVMAGSLLLKPDMSHIKTRPDIFIPGETYVPLAWDLSDLEQTCRRYLKDEAARVRIAKNAFSILSDYFRRGDFLTDMDPFFEKLLAPRG